jgi:C4-dicarboxylate-specific signal transduction histidine kinase
MRVSQVGELSGGLAHELTQPLTAILANAQAARLMLENSPADLSVIAEVLEDIIREDQRAGEVIRRLRSLLKDSENRSEDIDLNGLLEATLQLLKNEFISKRVNVICDFDPATPLVFGDQIQLQQVFLNLITNAIEAVHQMAIIRRSILIKTRRSTDDIVELNVIDHGVGIKPADQMRLFEPFFTTKERGLGLGLSICTTIVARHRGTLTLENNPEGGATASLRMPLEPESGARS